jgi:Dolichyl-phosphate-mannose-protein mannosyltransferase
MPTAGGRGTFLLWAALICGCSLALARVVLTLPLHVPLNYNEGWNAYHAADVLAGHSPYDSHRPYFFNNYPPVSFYVVAAATRLVPDPIVAGRWLAFASFALWVVALFEIAAMLGCRRAHAWFGALLFTAITLTFTDYVGIDDPQMLGHAIASIGLIALLGGRSGRSSVIVAALLFVLAVFVKQNLIALPIACVLWLARVDRRRAWLLTVAVIVAGALASAACVAAFGPAVISSLAMPRAILPLKGVWMVVQWLLRTLALGGCVMLVLRKHPRDSGVAFVATYAVVAAIVGGILGAGAGVNWNVFFDADWALCLASALALEHIGEGARTAGVARPSMLMAGCLIAPAIALLITSTPDRLSREYWVHPHAAEAADAARQISFLRAHPGPALCEDLALCFWAGKAGEVDVFNAGQQMLLGRTDPQPLIAEIERGGFAAVQMNTPARALGPEVSAAITRNYVIDHAAFNRVFLLPSPNRDRRE